VSLEKNDVLFIIIRAVSCRMEHTKASAKVRPQTLINRENQCRAGSASEQCDAASAIEAFKTVGTEQSAANAEESLTSSVGTNGR